jgi:selenocysteine lyase/cysteine desulfurase
MLSPRGTAFMAIRPGLLDAVVPQSAGWYAGEDPLATFFGPPLRLAETARRLDTSPAWFMWVATAPALGVLEQLGIDAIHDHDLALANRFRTGLGLEPGNSAIVFCDIKGGAERLERAGIRAAVRGGRLRTSWHVYNTDEDVQRTLDILLA